jgi:undecaprenyl phosphate N,N'-diacetylbacillosamine 1-phosphate transferase
MYKSNFKRFFDFCIALIGLIVLSPFLLFVIILLYFANKRAGVFFTQTRPGYKGKIFKVFKFKTMTDERDVNGKLLPDSERITKIGKIVRSFSIDELPQLLNILKGDMAFIGPRPLLVDYLPLYNQEQARRHDVRPGMSGWAQVQGRINLPFSKKFELDVWYVDHCSFLLDVKIIFLTIDNLLRRKDVLMGNHVATDTDDLGFTKNIEYRD